MARCTSSRCRTSRFQTMPELHISQRPTKSSTSIPVALSPEFACSVHFSGRLVVKPGRRESNVASNIYLGTPPFFGCGSVLGVWNLFRVGWSRRVMALSRVFSLEAECIADIKVYLIQSESSSLYVWSLGSRRELA